MAVFTRSLTLLEVASAMEKGFVIMSYYLIRQEIVVAALVLFAATYAIRRLEINYGTE